MIIDGATRPEGRSVTELLVIENLKLRAAGTYIGDILGNGKHHLANWHTDKCFWLMVAMVKLYLA